jgi:UDP-N-acetylglucosamine transferase subunit ALG13
MSVHVATSVAHDTWMGITPGARLLLVASSGGHLTELARIASKLEISVDSTWVTHDSPQARSLLSRYHDVRYVPYVAPRDVRGILRTVRTVRSIARRGDYAAVMSTGAGVALALALVPRRMRSLYVESMCRVTGPSLTGKLLERFPRVERRTQHASWASKRWPYEFTLLDEYAVVTRQRGSGPVGPLSILVTLGTIQPYRFDAAVEAVKNVLMPGDRVFWQVGCTTGHDLPGQVRESLGRVELRGVAAQCDVVISHAGVGTTVDLLDLGISPVLLPRRAEHGEHVDGHQAEIADVMAGKELATVRLPQDLTRDDLHLAANRMVVSRADLGADEGTPAFSADEFYEMLEAERGVA